MGFPGSSAGKESVCNAGDPGLIPGSGRSPGEEHGNPLQYSCLENPHGPRSLVDYSPWGHRVGQTEPLSTHTHTHTHTPLKCKLFSRAPMWMGLNSNLDPSHPTRPSRMLLILIVSQIPIPELKINSLWIAIHQMLAWKCFIALFIHYLFIHYLWCSV